MADVTIFHNSNCSTSRFALDEINEIGLDVKIVHYIKKPLDEAGLLDLLGKLEDEPAALVRQDGFFKDQGLKGSDYTTPEAVAKLLAQHPRLMQRPVLVRNGKAIIGRPRERVDEFLAD